MTVKRIRFIQELLEFVGLGGRVHLEWISSAEAQKFVRVVTEFTEKIRSLGPSPLKATATMCRSADARAESGKGIQPSPNQPLQFQLTA